MKHGMLDVKHKRCANHHCTELPLYGVDGSKKVEFSAMSTRVAE